MKIVLDASCVINLVNGGLFHVVLAQPEHQFSIGPLSYAECKGFYRAELDHAIVSGNLILLDDSQISAARFASLVNQFALGDGETECLLFAFDFDYSMASDDRKARATAQNQLGRSAVTGSLGLLKDAVQAGLISAEEAMQSYSKMLSSGAFLPAVDVDFFT